MLLRRSARCDERLKPSPVLRRNGKADTRAHPERRTRRRAWESHTGLVCPDQSTSALASNRAPNRLRGLSVNADECPSHVFRITEANRLRDAFDRFTGCL